MRWHRRRGVLLLALAIGAGGWLAAIASALSGIRQQMIFGFQAVSAAEEEGVRRVLPLGRSAAKPVPTFGAPRSETAPIDELAATSTDAVDGARGARAEAEVIVALFDDEDQDMRDAIADFVAGLELR